VLFVVLMVGMPLTLGVITEWGGVNSYFLHTLSASDRAAYLDAMASKGLKVVRIFISSVGKGNKGSSSSGAADLEDVTVGDYNDDILTMIDTLMLEASQKGIKLDIAMHDRYSLGCWAADAYVKKYGYTNTAPNCDTSKNQPSAFYTNANSQADFDRRLIHILTHKNPHFNNRAWGSISEAVFSFSPENEAQGHISSTDWNWHCRRAATMKPYISNGVLISTGGGVDFPTSLVTNNFKCDNISIIAIHSYDAGSWSSQLGNAKSLAKEYNKRIIAQEFGSTGSDSSKASSLGNQITAIANAGVPWMPWEFVNPQTTDYEFFTGTSTWNIVASHAESSLKMTGAFSWPEISGNSTFTGARLGVQ